MADKRAKITFFQLPTASYPPTWSLGLQVTFSFPLLHTLFISLNPSSTQNDKIKPFADQQYISAMTMNTRNFKIRLNIAGSLGT